MPDSIVRGCSFHVVCARLSFGSPRSPEVVHVLILQRAPAGGVSPLTSETLPERVTFRFLSPCPWSIHSFLQFPLNYTTEHKRDLRLLGQRPYLQRVAERAHTLEQGRDKRRPWRARAREASWSLSVHLDAHLVRLYCKSDAMCVLHNSTLPSKARRRTDVRKPPPQLVDWQSTIAARARRVPPRSRCRPRTLRGACVLRPSLRPRSPCPSGATRPPKRSRTQAT